MSVPLFVRKATSVRVGSSAVMMTNADASVAWPHSSTSTVGVNQRKLNASPCAWKNAVSERLFSAAMSCMSASGMSPSSGHTAAGLPAKGRFVKAST